MRRGMFRLVFGGDGRLPIILLFIFAADLAVKYFTGAKTAFGTVAAGDLGIIPFDTAIFTAIATLANGVVSGIQNRKGRKEQMRADARAVKEDRRRYEDDLRQRDFENRQSSEQHRLSMDVGRESLEDLRRKHKARDAFATGFSSR